MDSGPCSLPPGNPASRSATPGSPTCHGPAALREARAHATARGPNRSTPVPPRPPLPTRRSPLGRNTPATAQIRAKLKSPERASRRKTIRDCGSPAVRTARNELRPPFKFGRRRRTLSLTRASTRGQTTKHSPGLDSTHVNHRPTPTWPNRAFTHPFGVDGVGWGPLTGGVASLDPRLISVTPLGVDGRDYVASPWEDRFPICCMG